MPDGGALALFPDLGVGEHQARDGDCRRLLGDEEDKRMTETVTRAEAEMAPGEVA